MVWIPATAVELRQALLDGTLPHESSVYEYKQQLPHSSKNSDIAVDVSAMTVDGGVIIYGVAEDKVAATFSAHPIPLAGQLERISSTVAASVMEVPPFDVKLLPTPEDNSQGFIVVEVPASARAPHMVEVKGENRYYGRLPGGNRVLPETEVSRLYVRRQTAELEAASVLDDAIAMAPSSPVSGQRGDLTLVARTVLSDSGVRLRALPNETEVELANAIVTPTHEMRFRHLWTPSFSDILNGGSFAHTVEGVAYTNLPVAGQTGEPLERYYSRLEVLDDGTVRYFRAEIAGFISDRWNDNQQVFVLREPAVLQLAAHFSRFVGTLLQAPAYRGPVDLHLAIRQGSCIRHNA